MVVMENQEPDCPPVGLTSISVLAMFLSNVDAQIAGISYCQHVHKGGFIAMSGRRVDLYACGVSPELTTSIYYPSIESAAFFPPDSARFIMYPASELPN